MIVLLTWFTTGCHWLTICCLCSHTWHTAKCQLCRQLHSLCNYVGKKAAVLTIFILLISSFIIGNLWIDKRASRPWVIFVGSWRAGRVWPLVLVTFQFRTLFLFVIYWIHGRKIFFIVVLGWFDSLISFLNKRRKRKTKREHWRVPEPERGSCSRSRVIDALPPFVGPDVGTQPILLVHYFKWHGRTIVLLFSL
jgi:hypothetical protein